MKLTIRRRPNRNRTLSTQSIENRVQVFLPVDNRIKGNGTVSLKRIIRRISRFCPKGELRVLARKRSTIDFPNMDGDCIVTLFFNGCSTINFRLATSTTRRLVSTVSKVHFIRTRTSNIICEYLGRRRLIRTRVLN